MGLIDNVNELRQETQVAMEQFLKAIKKESIEKEPVERESVKKEVMKKNNSEYQQLLEEYRTSLKEYQDHLGEYRTSLEQYQERLGTVCATQEGQMAEDQIKEEQLSQELTYIKEGLNGIAGRQKEIGDKILKIDTTIIEPIKKNYTANRTATVEKLDEVMEAVKNSNKGLKIALWISLFFNAACAAGLVFIILWILQVIII